MSRLSDEQLKMLRQKMENSAHMPGSPTGMVCAVIDELLSARRELAELRRNDGWVSVGERLPEDSGDVLLYDGESFYVAYWRNEFKSWDSDKYGWLPDDVIVTHWRPLPEPPEV